MCIVNFSSVGLAQQFVSVPIVPPIGSFYPGCFPMATFSGVSPRAPKSPSEIPLPPLRPETVSKSHILLVKAHLGDFGALRKWPCETP